MRSSNGGGIGILVADYLGGTVQNNLISHNEISGTLYVDPEDGGGYCGSGIVLYADFRWDRPGSIAIKENLVIHNKINITSDTPDLVNIVAFELTDTRNNIAAVPFPVLFDNAIGFNDFRGTTAQIVVSPAELSGYNDISRNLGENRGHGLHPAIFSPGEY